jgi:hypothetical protein
MKTQLTNNEKRAYKAWLTIRKRYSQDEISERARQAAYKAWETMRSRNLRRALTVLVGILTLCAALSAQADDHRHRERERSHNWIIERQTNYQVPSSSTPSDRIIVGRREIDIYSNGQMFEGDHMVGERQ